MLFFKNHIQRETFYRMSLLIFIGLFFLIFISLIPSFLTPILLSIISTYLLLPLVNFLERNKIPRSLGVLMIYLLIFYLLFYALQNFYFKFVNQFEGLQKDIPNIVQIQLNNLQNFENKYFNDYPFIKNFELVSRVKEFFIKFSDKAILNTPKWISNIFTLFIFIPFFTFFFLKDSRAIKKWILNLLPNKYFESGLQVIYDVNKNMSNYIQGRLWEAFIVGVLTYLGFLIIDLKYALLLAIIAAVLNLVPYIGPIVAAIPALLISFYYSDSVWLVFFTLLIYLIAQLFDSVILIPLIFSKIVNIHPAMVIVLVIIGGHVLGVLGMIFAVPLYSVIKAISDAVFVRIVAK